MKIEIWFNSNGDVDDEGDEREDFHSFIHS